MNGRRITALIAGLMTLWPLFSGAVMAQDAPAPPVATPVVAAPAVPALSPVILTENPDVVQRFAVQADQVHEMVNRSLLKLTSAPDIGTAWTRLGIKPTDVVGIKITTIGGSLFSTHRPVVQAICDGLQAAGVPPSQIIVWDKDAADMREAGYTPVGTTDTQVGIASVFPGTGYDPTAIYKNDIVGTLIWGDLDFIRNGTDSISDALHSAIKKKGFGEDAALGDLPAPHDSSDTLIGGSPLPQTSENSHFARLVSTICTKIINVPVLTDNSAIGMEGCMGSLALGSVDNNRRFVGDPSYGNPAICEIVSNPLLRRKVVVHILDSLVAQYAGGPHFDPQFTRSIGAIYVSRDPVAIDSLVLTRMELWRAEDRDGRIDPIGKAADYIHAAPSYNLGTDDPHRIQLVKLP
jgi:hypothetical protein